MATIALMPKKKKKKGLTLVRLRVLPTIKKATISMTILSHKITISLSNLGTGN